MEYDPDPSRVLVVTVAGELDERAARSIVADVDARANRETALIVLSLDQATAVRWNAACALGRAVAGWRAACRGVVVRGPRPSLRSVLAMAKLSP